MTANNPYELPHPELVLRAAEEEPPQRLLDDYTAAIHALRQKNFTFREIAEWLKKFDFEVDHNAVYRAYAKTVSAFQAAKEAELDEELERDEAMREAELNGTLVHHSAVPAPEKSIETPVKEKPSKAAAKKTKHEMK
jgi:DNA-binding transcriptional MerR regulator